MSKTMIVVSGVVGTATGKGFLRMGVAPHEQRPRRVSWSPPLEEA
jgi:hypothetical protein